MPVGGIAIQHPLHLFPFAALVALAVAGCFNAPDNDGPADAGPQDEAARPTEIPWGFEDCTWVVAAIPTTADAVVPHYPEGFTPMTPEEMGLPPRPGADAVMGLEAFDCARGAGMNGSVEPMAYSAYWSPAHPPEERSRDGALLQFVKWDVLIPDDDRRAFLLEVGVPAVDGSVDLSGFEQTPAGYAFDVPFTIGDDSHRFVGTATGEPSAEMMDFTAREFTQTPAGLVLWDTQVVSPNMLQGAGTVTLAAGSFPAKVLGSEQVDSFFISGTSASFENGLVHLPTAP